MSGRSLYGELITCPEESYRLQSVVVCDLKKPVNEDAVADWGGGGRGLLHNKQTNKTLPRLWAEFPVSIKFVPFKMFPIPAFVHPISALFDPTDHPNIFC